MSVWAIILSVVLLSSFFQFYMLVTSATSHYDKHLITVGISLIVTIVFIIAFLFGIRPTILELLNEKKKLLKYANTDPLTQLYNRRAFSIAFDREINLLNRGASKKAALVLMDLDDFKRVNDVFGHDVGDIVLKGVSSTLKHTIRSTDVLARFGGEEFILLLPDTTVENALILCEKIRVTISEQSCKYAPNTSLSMTTLSMGVVPLSKEQDFDEHLTQVDKILYKAKHAGKNCIKTH
jgi:diguanylate cyclase (GGDEF)-like protein